MSALRPFVPRNEVSFMSCAPARFLILSHVDFPAMEALLSVLLAIAAGSASGILLLVGFAAASRRRQPATVDLVADSANDPVFATVGTNGWVTPQA
jgi:hypothetical protein